MAGRSTKAHHHHRAEASSPATSVAVAAARANDAPRSRARAREREREPQPQEAHQLRRSAAFPPRRQLHQRCSSERNIMQHGGCGEVAGGTAAGCAAVCCCFPCVMVEVVVLATVRAPAALCRKAARARRGRRRSASAGQAAEIYELLVDDGGVVESGAGAAEAVALPVKPGLDETEELEKEVWARFYGAGFWRSPSRLGDEIR
ncbi:uncharacterized protein LOC133914226 [Phragmites australis]|uniref:uncharacterized protein LOC133914226 n=1 Tax=Phragmites australis TaxID=29695 RepID=UPI002D766078|nr:uncharacterized protein LOC133914226 [Phragmites australis]